MPTEIGREKAVGIQLGAENLGLFGVEFCFTEHAGLPQLAELCQLGQVVVADPGGSRGCRWRGGLSLLLRSDLRLYLSLDVCLLLVVGLLLLGVLLLRLPLLVTAHAARHGRRGARDYSGTRGRPDQAGATPHRNASTHVYRSLPLG